MLLHALGAAANVTYCWGSGSTGQLGDGQGGGAYTQPVPTAVPNAPEFAAVKAGLKHTCGLTAAGQAYCWGQALNGELGVGDTNSTYLAVPTSVAGNLSFSDISLGEKFTCGIAGSKAFCWGSGESGRLGSGSNASSSTPAEVAGVYKFAVIATGQAHACALTPEGQAWCWGENFFGQLGDNSTNSSAVPVRVATNQTFAAISAGDAHTCALVAVSRRPFCWGSNVDGQLGSNATNLATVPIPVANSSYSSPYSFASLSTGGMFSCGNVVGAMYETYCWGDNDRGQLGPVPDYGFTDQPVRLPGTQRFASISAAGSWRAALVPTSPFLCFPPAHPAVAVLAFLAFRPRKGWLRRRGTAAAEQGGKGDVEMSPGDKVVMLTPLPTGVLDSFLPPEVKLSQALALAAPDSAGSSGPTNAPNSSGNMRDPLLLYISTYLASQPSSRSAPRALPQHPGSGSGGSGGGVSSSSGGAGQALSPEANMWQLQWGELEIDRQVGRGSFGTVYRARWHETPVAVKVLVDRDASLENAGLELPDEKMRELEDEAAVMIRMRHPNVVQFLGLCQLPPALVTEYCARGSLYSCLQAARANSTAAAELTWARRLSMAIDAGTGLLYLHSRNIVHRDVKSPNYLVADHWGVKVSDFNLSRLLGDTGPSLLSAGGVSNPVWLAPELMSGGHATTASDV
ncbi:hypothetical protein COHA_007653 [Chlorella ohadii]|uniref:Protein kinase domain-containing protein n=1 Tax=Chlorella ohadii TaxID=2649997 RepID=A0AAD5H413_9CHLO|nr:hypothetical protein COHA_007653 [Chlorella ohadii]